MTKQFEPFRYFLRFSLKYRKLLVLYFISMVVYSSAKGYPVYLSRKFLNYFFYDIHTHADEINRIILIIIGCGVLIGIFSYIYRYVGYFLSSCIGIDIKNNIYNHFTSLPLSYFERQEKGDLITKMTHDTGATSNIVKKVFVLLLPRAIELTAFTIICFTLCWQLGLLFFIFIPLISLLIYSFAKKITRRSRKSKEILSESTVTMEQFFHGIKLIKSFYSHEREEEKFRNVNDEFVKARLSTARVQSRAVAIPELLGTWLMAGIIALGTYLLTRKLFGLEPGVLVAFLGSFFIVADKCKRVAQLSVEIIRQHPSVQRLYEILQTESDITITVGAVDIETIEPGIEFKDVHFAYEDDDVIKGISLDIQPGQMVAFVGPSGGGKTTLLDLVPHFYEIDSGEIRIGGYNIRDIKPDSLMSRIAIVLQDSFIFNSSALENIRYGRPEATDEQVKEAAQQANVNEDIEKLPKGYKTFLGEEGVKLSGGQKQRLSIARSLVKGADILIMDEPTSELDSHSEKLIIDTLEDIRKNRILLVIAHRLSTILHSDMIVVINDGRIEAQGTHEELLEISPTYTRMYEIQFKDSSGGTPQR